MYYIIDSALLILLIFIITDLKTTQKKIDYIYKVIKSQNQNIKS